MHPWQKGNPHQLWSLSGNRIVNLENEDEVLDIEYGSEDNGAGVIAYSYAGSDNQHWRPVYLSE